MGNSAIKLTYMHYHHQMEMKIAIVTNYVIIFVLTHTFHSGLKSEKVQIGKVTELFASNTKIIVFFYLFLHTTTDPFTAALFKKS